MKKLKGSLTVFFALILTATMALIFTMTECVRVYALKNLSNSYTQIAAESCFSQYNPQLWADYKILAVDKSLGLETQDSQMLSSKALDYASYNSNGEDKVSLLRLKPVVSSLESYGLITDEEGAAVIYQGVKYTKENLALALFEAKTKEAGEVNSLEEANVEEKVSNGKGQLNSAKDEIIEKRQKAMDDDDPNTSPDDYPEPEEIEDNPLDAYEKFKESMAGGVINTILPADAEISEENLNLSDVPSHRSLSSGTKSLEDKENLIDRAIYTQYLLNNFSYYGNDLSHLGLNYEVEYVINGKASDKENLAATVEKLLIVREAANYATIEKSPSLRAEAGGVAAAICSFAPELIGPVTIAVKAAWAYAESVLDVRRILAGGKVTTIKNESQWTSDVWHLSAFLDKSVMAKNCTSGISYEEYLRGLLLTEGMGKLGLRSCDIFENALNKSEDYKNLKADSLVFMADFEIEYQAKSMFLKFFNNRENYTEGYKFTTKKELIY